ncbi:TetR family transcriptional regulator [Paraburkholderia sp. BL23I1N1]|uniref:TetR/AcrR family transcriptional regulator n=1 Tax=Paraburkholderia sp. BL23I1N1 TaxID=1938802 RepID=UPI000E746DF4|nr:TetR/AcrR family transcriptional regulator [Paraburkholderia sp. BL23I1N1]RKE37504.1 TetR family transcriptional regulator [Paraburkholderia sp. BL23I1N1]
MPRSKNCSTDSAQIFKSDFREHLVEIRVEYAIGKLPGVRVTGSWYDRISTNVPNAPPPNYQQPMTTEQNARVQRVHPESGPKARLVQEAILLFARHGIEGVSIRTLNKAAGITSQNAVYHYFGDMWGLVEAAIKLSINQYLDGVSGLLDAAENDAEMSGPLPLSTVVEAIVRPVVHIASSPEGMASLQFLARMIGGSGPRGKEVIAREWRNVAERVNDLVFRAVPENGREAAGAKALFAFNTALNVVVDVGLEAYWPLETRSNDRLDRYLLDYIEGGIRFSS